MRPASIVNFERFYLGSLIAALVSSYFSWDASLAAVQSESPPGLQFGSGILLMAIGIGVLIQLLLWYFVARRRSVVAKWIVVVFFVLTLVDLAATVISGAVSQGLITPVAFLISTVAVVLEALAVWMLFRPDAKDWFEGNAGANDAGAFS